MEEGTATQGRPPGWGLCTSILTSLSLLFHPFYPSQGAERKVLTEGRREAKEAESTYWRADFPAGEKIRVDLQE